MVYTAQAQSPIDSLNTLLEQHVKENGNDLQTAKILTELYNQSKQSNPFSSLQYAARALEIYSMEDDTANIALMHRYIGDNYFDREIYNMAMDSYAKSYDLYSSIGDETQEAYSVMRIGDTYLAQNLETNAAEQYYTALEIFKEKDDKKGLSYAYEKIAEIKLNEYSQETAMEYLDSALLLRRSLRNDELIALSYENIANAHLFNESYDQAEEFLERALDKYKVTNNKIKVGDIYFSLGRRFISEANYTEASENLLKALEIYKTYDILDKVTRVYNKLGFIHYKENNYSIAKEYADSALTISTANMFRESEKNTYKLLSDIYIDRGNYKAATEYLQKHTELINVLIEEERRKQSTELQVNLATQKKEQEIKLLKKDRQLQDARIKRNEAEQRTLYFSFALTVLVLIFAGFFGYYFYRTNKKTKAANNLLIEKNEHIQQQNEEINAQKDKLMEAYDSISKQKNEIENKSNKITSSLNYASRIQRAMLPKISEIKSDLKESFVMLSPKEAVSGDFFWYGKNTDENGREKIIITAVDCTGHGVPGAFMSMIGDAYLNQIIYQQHILKPDLILHELHKGINTALKQGTSNNTDGMDMSLCVIDLETNTLEYAGAKNPLVYLQNGELKVIKGDSNSIGGFTKGKSKSFTGHSLNIDVATQFYIYTDGFQDQFGGDQNKKYMAKRFRRFLKSIHTMPISDQATALAVELDDWRGDHSQMDDVLVIGFKIDPDTDTAN
jgi:serine phosphatase RsbU (regulator of sigma subunit)